MASPKVTLISLSFVLAHAAVALARTLPPSGSFSSEDNMSDYEEFFKCQDGLWTQEERQHLRGVALHICADEEEEQREWKRSLDEAQLSIDLLSGKEPVTPPGFEAFDAPIVAQRVLRSRRALLLCAGRRSSPTDPTEWTCGDDTDDPLPHAEADVQAISPFFGPTSFEEWHWGLEQMLEKGPAELLRHLNSTTSRQSWVRSPPAKAAPPAPVKYYGHPQGLPPLRFPVDDGTI